MRLEDWPKTKIPDGAVRRLEDVKNKYSNARFFKGEPLRLLVPEDEYQMRMAGHA